VQFKVKKIGAFVHFLKNYAKKALGIDDKDRSGDEESQKELVSF
jgi:hypothetical protein